jgi:hypothetical protein
LCTWSLEVSTLSMSPSHPLANRMGSASIGGDESSTYSRALCRERTNIQALRAVFRGLFTLSDSWRDVIRHDTQKQDQSYYRRTTSCVRSDKFTNVCWIVWTPHKRVFMPTEKNAHTNVGAKAFSAYLHRLKVLPSPLLNTALLEDATSLCWLSNCNSSKCRLPKIIANDTSYLNVPLPYLLISFFTTFY